MKVTRLSAVAGAIVVAALILLAFLGAPAGFLVGALQHFSETETGYRLQVGGHSRIYLLPMPTISLSDVSASQTQNAEEPLVHAASLRIALSIASLLTGAPRVTELTLVQPTLHLHVVRERQPQRAASPTAAVRADRTMQFPEIHRIHIQDGTVQLYSAPAHLENSIEHINVEASLGAADKSSSASATFSLGGQLIHFELKLQRTPQSLAQTIPIEFRLQAPNLPGPISGSAELKAGNATLAINSLTGRLGQSKFNGWTTVDFKAVKPFLDSDLSFDVLRIAQPADGNVTPAAEGSEGWSDQEYHFDGLNFFDAEVRLTADEFEFASAKVAPLTAEGTLKSGALKVNVVKAGLYDGEASGTISLDVSGAAAREAARLNLQGVNARLLLSHLAGFDYLDGTMQADIAVNATGASEKSIISNTAGDISVKLENGDIRGIDLLKMVQSLAASIMTGWQPNAGENTTLSQFDVRLRIVDGVAEIETLELTGPVIHMGGSGKIDLTTKTLHLRVDPRLAAGRSAFGVPVVVEGPWSEPRIYPDIPGILADPDDAYARLKAAGEGLFGNTDRPATDGPGVNSLIENLGKLLMAPPANPTGSPRSNR